MRRPLSVVLAEDGETYRRVISVAVRSHPDLTLVADVGDGIDAVTAIERERPDLALVDFDLPGIDGLEVCRRVRALPDSPPTRFLLLSAALEQLVVPDIVAAGYEGWMEKSTSVLSICETLVRTGHGRFTRRQG